ncbi:hypothetical protein OY08_24360 [Salmonella enterica subsp. enterica]|nr:hypothetical protein [Salmonella enterica subsp. enterica serovar Nagoya]EED4104097.1 hypothetical protein [Salmonella enterica subsp. enterica serovar Nagoya]
MKKTLIALAVAASAAVSGSAMAWTANGTGGSVGLGGTLTPVEKVTPWEVKVGAAVNGLDANTQKGQKVVDVVVNKAIPVLGIRNANVAGFVGQSGIKPQINFGGAVDIDGFTAGVTTLTLNVKDASNSEIGRMTVPFSAAAVLNAQWGEAGNSNRTIYAADDIGSFFGGLGKSESAAIVDGTAALNLLNSLDADYLAKFTTGSSDAWDPAANGEKFSNADITYRASYGAGIEQGKTIKITLEQPVASDAIAWKASLPVTISYQ